MSQPSPEPVPPAVRAQIQKGSQNMPGFQNTFTPAQFEELITYLKQ